jgi:hypothetical protein
MVRAACEGERLASTEAPLAIQARAVDADAALADRLVAVRFPSGAVLISYTDHNGMLYTPAAPVEDASVVVENPASARLEAPELPEKAESSAPDTSAAPAAISAPASPAP